MKMTNRHDFQSAGHNGSFRDPAQSDDIYPPPPGFEGDRYRQYDGGDVERSAHAQKPKPEERQPATGEETVKTACTTKRIWGALKVTFILACPLFIIGLILVILGTVNVPESYDLARPGAPILIVAMILLIIGILLLVVYKMRGFNIYDVGDREMTGVMNNGMNPTSTRGSSDDGGRSGTNRDTETSENEEGRRHNESRRI